MATVGLVGNNHGFIIYYSNLLKNYLSHLFLKGRSLIKHAPAVTQNLEKKLASLPKSTFSFSSITDVKYYKGGFETKMTRREASLILGVR